MVWISRHWIWTSLYEQKIVSYGFLHSTYWSQWKNPAVFLSNTAEHSGLWSLTHQISLYVIWFDCPLISMWLCCTVSYIIGYLALCQAVSYTNLFGEQNVSPVINFDMFVLYQLKFRLMAYRPMTSRKRTWQIRPQIWSVFKGGKSTKIH